MRKVVVNALAVTALLLIPFAAPAGDFGCCQFENSCVDNATFMTCPLSGGEFTAGGVCTGDICGPPPPATPTPSPAPNGDSCTTSSQCTSMFCVDGVCCATECDGPTDRCDVAGREGLCTSFAPAPAASPWTLAVMGLVLMTIAAAAFRQLAR